MNFRKASLFALSFCFIVGSIFFFLSLNLPMSAVGLAIGSGYYPRLLSIALILSSAAGFIINYRNKENNNIDISIPHIGKFFLVLGLAILITLVWHLTREFYLVAFPVELILLWVLNPEPASKRKALKTLIIGGIMMGAIYGIFTGILQLSL